jgi:hypothetical protein
MNTETIAWIGMGMCVVAFLVGWFTPPKKKKDEGHRHHHHPRRGKAHAH